MAITSGAFSGPPRGKSPKEREKSRKASLIAALIEERRGYEMRGDKTNVAGVDAELRRLGHDPKPPAKKATKAKPKKPDAEF